VSLWKPRARNASIEHGFTRLPSRGD
jgi:hypothetical protein